MMRTYKLNYAEYLETLTPEKKEAELRSHNKRGNVATKDEPAKKKKKKDQVYNILRQ